MMHKKKIDLKYFLVVAVAVSSICITNMLSAGQNHDAEISHVQVPQALNDFVVQAMCQDLPIEQIVTQGLAQGYTKEQIIAACSVYMAQEDSESVSTERMLMYGALAAVIGIGAWYLYKWLTTEAQPAIPPAIVPQGNGPGIRNIGELQIGVQRLNIVPAHGAVLPPNGNQLINQHIQQGLAAGRNHEDIIRAVRQEFPDVAFQVRVNRELENDGIVAYQEQVAHHGPWNGQPVVDRILANMFQGDGAQPIPGLQPNQVLVEQGAEQPQQQRFEIVAADGFNLPPLLGQELSDEFNRRFVVGRQQLDLRVNLIDQMGQRFPDVGLQQLDLRINLMNEMRQRVPDVGLQLNHPNFMGHDVYAPWNIAFPPVHYDVD